MENTSPVPPESNQHVPLPGVMVLVIIVLLVGAFFGWGVYHYLRPLSSPSSESLANETPGTTSTETVENTSAVSTNWPTYTSSTYGYSFSYPGSWSTVFYDEETAVTGVHSLSNYSTTAIEEFAEQNGGVAKYGRYTAEGNPGTTQLFQDFLGEQPALNVQLTVEQTAASDTEFEARTRQNITTDQMSGAKYTSGPADLKIGSYPTEMVVVPDTPARVYFAFPNSYTAVTITVWFRNVDLTTETYQQTDDWTELRDIFTSFRFNE